MANKESMIFYQEWRKAVEELPTEQRCRIYEAIFDYAFAGIEPQDAIIGAITSIMRMKIDKDREAYETVCERNRANVRKRWEKAKQATANQKDTAKSQNIRPYTTVCDRIREDTKNTDNYSYSDSYNDVPNGTINITLANARASATADEAGQAGKEEKVNFEALLKFFNDEMNKAQALIPRAKSITGQRLTLLKARIREYGKEAVADVIRKSARSDFLNGGGSKGFKADMTWIMRPENFLKILEGNYDNNPQTLTTTTRNRHDTAPINHGNTDTNQNDITRLVARKLSTPESPEPDISGDY